MNLIIVLYWLSFVANCLWTGSIVCYYLYKYYDAFVVLDLICPKLREKLSVLYLMMIVHFRQWMNKNLVKLDNGTYEVNLVINGKLVKIKLERVTPRVVDVQDDEESIMNKVEPYLLYKQLEWKHDNAVIYYEDGTSSK